MEPNFYLALSCLQGRPRGEAIRDLRAIEGVFALQLTPGNTPISPELLAAALAGVVTRTHHGYSERAYRRQVWSDDRRTCLVGADSVHPPRFETREDARAWVGALIGGEIDLPKGTALETMYGDYALGTEEEIRLAMEAGVLLAVDISHVYLQCVAGVAKPALLKDLFGDSHVAEIHVSANAGQADSHQPIRRDTFGLEEAIRASRERSIPLILESYFHRLTEEERAAQVALLQWR